MSITTKKGDDGFTTNFLGEKVKKNHISIEISGLIDESVSILGIMRSLLNDLKTINIIESIQSDLLSLFSHKEEVFANQICFFEQYILDNEKKTNSFILPGRSTQSAYTHFARTYIRKLERKIIEYNQKQIISIYLNRMSDFLFVFAENL